MIYTLKSELKFGKNNGQMIEEIIKGDPDWLAWACDNIEWVELDEDASEALEIALFDDYGKHESLPL